MREIRAERDRRRAVSASARNRSGLDELDADAPALQVAESVVFLRIGGLDPELVRGCVDDTRRRFESERARNQQLDNKPYFMQFTRLADDSADAAPFRPATTPGVEKSVADYLGSFPLLYNITAVFSPSGEQIGVRSAADWEGSQLFHRDGEDRRLLKLWVLCSDVTEEHGPTMVLPAKVSQRLANRLRYSPGIKMPDEPFLKYWDSVQSATGPSGTVYATDTARCFHFGSRTTTKSSRLVLMIHYPTEQSPFYSKTAAARREDDGARFAGLPMAERRLLGYV